MHKSYKREEVFKVSFRKGKREGGFSDEVIFQEILITKEGHVVIPWIKPEASRLVLDLWESFNKKESFPVTVFSGHIYCG